MPAREVFVVQQDGKLLSRVDFTFSAGIVTSLQSRELDALGIFDAREQSGRAGRIERHDRSQRIEPCFISALHEAVDRTSKGTT